MEKNVFKNLSDRARLRFEVSVAVALWVTAFILLVATPHDSLLWLAIFMATLATALSLTLALMLIHPFLWTVYPDEPETEVRPEPRKHFTIIDRVLPGEVADLKTERERRRPA